MICLKPKSLARMIYQAAPKIAHFFVKPLQVVLKRSCIQSASASPSAPFYYRIQRGVSYELLGLVALLPIVLSACYFDTGTGGGGSSIISFENEIAPLLVQSCASLGCHDSITAQANLNLEVDMLRSPSVVFSDLQALSLMDTVNPEQSLLLTQAANSDANDPHGGGPVFDVGDSNFQLIVDWINEGLFNDDCSGITHAYANDVLPALNACSGSGCHDASASLQLAGADAFLSMQDHINTGDPYQSELLQSGLGQNGHPAGAIFGSNADPGFKTTFCWIKEDQAIEN